MEKKRIIELSNFKYSDDLYMAVDNEVSGTGSIQLGNFASGILGQKCGEMAIDYPDDPMGVGYKYMMTTKFASPATETQESAEYVTIDILGNSKVSSVVKSISLPYVLNLSATQYSCARLQWNNGTSFFTTTRDPDVPAISSGVPVLTPIALSGTNTSFQAKSIHIVSKLATLDEMGLTEIYNDNPFSDVIGQEAYAFGGKRINIDFSDTKIAAIQLVVDTELPPEIRPTVGILALGFAIDDTFTRADEIITGTSRSAVDPSGAYMNLSEYKYKTGNLNVINFRSNRGNQDFAFPEDFQTVMPASYSAYYNRPFTTAYRGNIYYPTTVNNTTATSGNAHACSFRMSGKFNDFKVLSNIDKSYSKIYRTYKYASGTETVNTTQLNDFKSMRLIVGTGTKYYNYATKAMASKFKIKNCVLKIYK